MNQDEMKAAEGADTSAAKAKDIPVRVSYEGETVDADEMPFESISSVVGRFKVSDGADITFRHTVNHIYRLKTKTKPDGSPIYLVTGEAQLHVTHPTNSVGDESSCR